jgi:hypothetical protein
MSVFSLRNANLIASAEISISQRGLGEHRECLGTSAKVVNCLATSSLVQSSHSSLTRPIPDCNQRWVESVKVSTIPVSLSRR